LQRQQENLCFLMHYPADTDFASTIRIEKKYSVEIKWKLKEESTSFSRQPPKKNQ
jgi:hypothetical protein